MRVELQPSYLLHQKPYRNTSMLLDVLTHDYGRISLVAKGVRTNKSAKRSLLQPFNSLYLSWVGKSELQTMTHVEAKALPYRLSGKFLYSGFYLNELLVRLLHKHDPHELLFNQYENALNALQLGSELEPILRRFEYDLLKELGYELPLRLEAYTAAPVLVGRWYRYNIELGPILNSGTVAADLGNCFSGKSLLALADEQFDADECKKEIKTLMRLVLMHYLGDKPLKSRELFYS